jgi:hypothetical protein
LLINQQIFKIDLFNLITKMVQHKHRVKRFQPPTVRAIKTKFENYAIITQYHGGAYRYCTVQAYDADENKVVEFKQVRMKGSILHSKCKQRVSVGSYILLAYGEIALIYKDSSLIPDEILTALDAAAGIAESIHRGVKTEDNFEESDLDGEYEGEGEGEDLSVSNPDLI